MMFVLVGVLMCSTVGLAEFSDPPPDDLDVISKRLITAPLLHAPPGSERRSQHNFYEPLLHSLPGKRGRREELSLTMPVDEGYEQGYPLLHALFGKRSHPSDELRFDEFAQDGGLDLLDLAPPRGAFSELNSAFSPQDVAVRFPNPAKRYLTAPIFGKMFRNGWSPRFQKGKGHRG